MEEDDPEVDRFQFFDRESVSSNSEEDKTSDLGASHEATIRKRSNTSPEGLVSQCPISKSALPGFEEPLDSDSDSSSGSEESPDNELSDMITTIKTGFNTGK